MRLKLLIILLLCSFSVSAQWNGQIQFGAYNKLSYFKGWLKTDSVIYEGNNRVVDSGNTITINGVTKSAYNPSFTVTGTVASIDSTYWASIPYVDSLVAAMSSAGFDSTYIYQYIDSLYAEALAYADSLYTDAISQDDTGTTQTLYIPSNDSIGITGGNVIEIPWLDAEVDGSITNELQTISKAGSTITLSNGGGSYTDDTGTAQVLSLIGLDSLSISGGNTIHVPWITSFVEVDGSVTNELQNLSSSKVGNNVTVNISSGTGTTFTIADDDSSNTNEIQILTISNDTVYLTNGGYIVLPEDQHIVSAAYFSDTLRLYKESGDSLLVEITTSGGGLGSVTSVGLSLPNIFSVSGSPVTTSGTLTGSLVTQSANTVFAGPVSGGAATPGFRALVEDDIPALNYQPPGDYALQQSLDDSMQVVRDSLTDIRADIPDVSTFVTQTQTDALYPHRSDSNQITPYGYATVPFVASSYQPIGNYVDSTELIDSMNAVIDSLINYISLLPAPGITATLAADNVDTTGELIMYDGVIWARLFKISNTTNGFFVSHIAPTVSAARVITWPDATGTPALLTHQQTFTHKNYSNPVASNMPTSAAPTYVVVKESGSDTLKLAAFPTGGGSGTDNWNNFTNIPQNIADLEAIAFSNGEFLQYTGGALVNRTASQVKTALGIAWSDIGSTPTTLGGYGITNGALNGAIGSSGLTMNTARLLGRTTASSGAVEEITVNSPLTFTGGALDITAIPISDLNITGTPDGTKFLKDDGSWAVPSGGGGVTDGDKGDITVSGSGATWNIDAATVGVTELSATGTPSSSTFLRGDNTWGTPSGGSSTYIVQKLANYSVNGTGSNATLIFTTAAGGNNFIVTGVRYKVATKTGSGSSASLSVGTNATSYNNITSSLSANSGDAVGEVRVAALSSPYISIPASTEVYVRINTNATHTTYTINIFIEGYYEP